MSLLVAVTAPVIYQILLLVGVRGVVRINVLEFVVCVCVCLRLYLWSG